MKKQRYCPDFMAKVKSHSEEIGFTYPVGSWELNLCRSCEGKLREGILKQIEVEKSLK